jgi:hypothetical protein
MKLKEMQRIWQDEFNRCRTLIEIGKKLALIEQYAKKEDFALMNQLYADGDVSALKILLKPREKV